MSKKKPTTEVEGIEDEFEIPELPPVERPKQKKSTITKVKDPILDRLRSDEIKSLIKLTQNKFGKSSIGGGHMPLPQVQCWSSGYVDLDRAIGGDNPNRQGLPRARIMEIAGPESGGKTTLTLACTGQGQKHGLFPVFIDVEKSLDPKFAENLGVDLERMLYLQPAYGEEAVEMIRLWSAQADIMVVDSFGALFSKENADKDTSEAAVRADRAKLINKIIMVTSDALAKRDMSLWAINQFRANMAAAGKPYLPQEQTTGGHFARYMFGIRLDVRKGDRVEDKKTGLLTGIGIKVRVTKNKIAPPFGTCQLHLDFKHGISIERGLYEEAIKLKVVGRKSGGNHEFGEIKVKGKEAFLVMMEEQPELTEKIRDCIRKAYENKVAEHEAEFAAEPAEGEGLDPDEYTIDEDIQLE